MKKISVYRFAEWLTGETWQYIDGNYGNDNIEEINEEYEAYLESPFADPQDWAKSLYSNINFVSPFEDGELTPAAREAWEAVEQAIADEIGEYVVTEGPKTGTGDIDECRFSDRGKAVDYATQLVDHLTSAEARKTSVVVTDLAGDVIWSDELHYAAAWCPESQWLVLTEQAGNPKKFLLLENARIEETAADVYPRYEALAVSLDDKPDGDGDIPTYRVFWDVLSEYVLWDEEQKEYVVDDWDDDIYAGMDDVEKIGAFSRGDGRYLPREDESWVCDWAHADDVVDADYISTDEAARRCRRLYC